MDEKTYKITLADGTELSDLRLNGNNFISKVPVAPEIFEGNCSTVTISDGLAEETHENMSLVQVKEMNGEYWFIIRDLTPEELYRIKIQADIEYIAMMSSIEL